MSKETLAVTYEHDGRILTLKQWAQHLGLHPQAIRNRIKSGWPLERALTERRAVPAPATDQELVDGPARWVIRGVVADDHQFECCCVECIAEIRSIEDHVAECEAHRKVLETPESIEAKLISRLLSELALAGIEVVHG